MKKYDIDKDLLVKMLANKASFTQGDSRVFLDALIEIFEECVRTGKTMKVNGFGELASTQIRSESGRGIKTFLVSEDRKYPSAKRVNFKLSNNIRFAYKNEYKEDEL